MWRKTTVLVVCVILLASCGLMATGPTLKQRLQYKLRPGLEWTVRVKYWPDRFDHPYVDSDTPLVGTVRYRVLERSPSESTRRVLVQADAFEGLLTLNSTGNVTFASRIARRRASGLIKTQQILDNRLGDRAFFTPGWSPGRAIFWFHPDLAVRSNRRLFSLDGSGADRIVQTTHCKADQCRIRLIHRPTRSTVDFLWRKGSPWWDRAEWYRSDRLIAFAERIT